MNNQNPMKKKPQMKVIVLTSIFWILTAVVVVGFVIYGEAKYNSGINAGFDKAQTLLQQK
jgi:hypothetical protein